MTEIMHEDESRIFIKQGLYFIRSKFFQDVSTREEFQFRKLLWYILFIILQKGIELSIIIR